MPVTITVDAFPNRTFDGSVLKIEPQAQVTQNVTMFPVQVNIPNTGHVLQAGDEHRGRDPYRTAPGRPRSAERRAADAA